MNMQDKKHMEDKGWMAMHALLDKEMPDRRRISFIWWIIGIGIPLIVCGILLFHWNPEEKVSQTDENYTAYKSMSASKELFNKLEKEFPQSSEPQLAELSFGQEKANIAVSDQLAKRMSKTQAKEEDKNTFPDDFNILKESLTSVSSPHLDQVITKKADSSLEKRGTKGINSNAYLAPFSPIALMEAPLITSTKKQEFSNVPDVKISMKSDHSLHPDIFATLYNSLYNVPGGFEVGIGIWYQLSNKWNLYARLSYGQYYRSGYDPVFRISSFQASDSYFEEANNLDYVNLDKSFASYEETVTLVDRLDYLHLPLGIRYKIHSRWDINLGTRLSYLLSGRNSIGNSFAANSALKDGLGVNALLYENNYYRSFDLAFSAGIRYHLHRHWFIGVMYNNGMYNILDVDKIQGSTDRRDYNRDLGLSVTYTF